MNDTIPSPPSGKSPSKIALILFTACFTLTLFAAARIHARDLRRASHPQSQTSGSPPSQTPSAPPSPSSSGMARMPGMNMPETPANPASGAARAANADMDGDMHMNMAHMFMTPLGPPNAPDQALAEGFRIFAPNFPQPVYHFTSRSNAIRAQFTFDPTRPTSLLYKKVGGGYELVGAMYTAPRRCTEDQLNERVPLSVARWHKHVNFCLAPRGTPRSQVDHSRFGFNGSLASEDACHAAGGRWIPQVFNWMVHVYPYQSDPGKVWAH